MRFAGDLVKQANPNDTFNDPQGWNDALQYELMKKHKPVVPGFNTEDLQRTPALTPKPGAEMFPQEGGPALDLLKDKFIRNKFKSGVT